VLDARHFGGQAGASARIENYLGFPTGISGQALAGRAYNQAQKFGADMMIPVEAKSLDCAKSGGVFGLTTACGHFLKAKSVVVASGARYRRPTIENLAGQAAVFLSGHASKVRMMIRSGGLADSMSRYLIDRIMATPNIELMIHTEIVRLEGADGGLERVRWRNRKSGIEAEGEIRNVFLFVGADPATAWLADCGVTLDRTGFILTGAQCGQPMSALETSVPGVFAVGDVRAGSVKRMGGAIGEGAQVVAALHGFLGDKPASPL
jgi:thioredoxin reductase (NADPH)